MINGLLHYGQHRDYSDKLLASSDRLAKNLTGKVSSKEGCPKCGVGHLAYGETYSFAKCLADPPLPLQGADFSRYLSSLKIHLIHAG